MRLVFRGINIYLSCPPVCIYLKVINLLNVTNFVLALKKGFDKYLVLLRI